MGVDYYIKVVAPFSEKDKRFIRKCIKKKELQLDNVLSFYDYYWSEDVKCPYVSLVEHLAFFTTLERDVFDEYKVAELLGVKEKPVDVRVDWSSNVVFLFTADGKTHELPIGGWTQKRINRDLGGKTVVGFSAVNCPVSIDLSDMDMLAKLDREVLDCYGERVMNTKPYPLSTRMVKHLRESSDWDEKLADTVKSASPDRVVCYCKNW